MSCEYTLKSDRRKSGLYLVDVKRESVRFRHSVQLKRRRSYAPTIRTVVIAPFRCQSICLGPPVNWSLLWVPNGLWPYHCLYKVIPLFILNGVFGQWVSSERKVKFSCHYLVDEWPSQNVYRRDYRRVVAILNVRVFVECRDYPKGPTRKPFRKYFENVFKNNYYFPTVRGNFRDNRYAVRRSPLFSILDFRRDEWFSRKPVRWKNLKGFIGHPIMESDRNVFMSMTNEKFLRL